MTFAVVHPDCTVEELPDDCGVRAFQQAVGGYIENIPSYRGNDLRVYGNEHAAITNPPAPLNRVATEALGIDVRGTVVFVGGWNEEGDDLPLNTEMWAEIHKNVAAVTG